VRGNPEVLVNPQLAMVGSRNPSASGRETAHDFARTLAAAGVVITSGLASGIDSASHRGALDGAGQTIAVAGTGLDRVYPAANRELAHAIVDTGGAIVAEFPPGTPPHAGNFPRRNRIISGLSLGTLVVEQGREVFAIPGSIHNPLARGCHQLIRQGAKLVESAGDILEELAPQLYALLEAEEGEALPAAGGPELDVEYQRLD
jgi:DNA processing protein